MEQLRSNNRIYFAFFLFLFAAIAVLIIVFNTEKNPTVTITNFDDCAKAGYPVMQSYPPQCTLPNGRFFVQQVLPQQ